MSWIWPEFVSPDLSLTKAQRKQIHRDAWKLWQADKRNWALYLSIPAVYLLILLFAIDDLGDGLAALTGAGGLIRIVYRFAAPFVLFALCFVVGGAVLQRVRFAPCVYRATRMAGYEVCVKCGYWLRGLGPVVDRCPECGSPVETTDTPT